MQARLTTGAQAPTLAAGYFCQGALLLPSSSRWHITPDASDDQAYAILAQDPVWNSFALADLEPPLRVYSQFAIASRDDSPERAICLILRHPIIGDVLSPFGEEEAVAALLQHIPLPERPLIQAQAHHVPLLSRRYRADTTWRSMLRMALSSASWRRPPLPAVSALPVTLLSPSDVPALNQLYSRHTESTFSPDLFSQGLYVGIRDADRIVAAGGTHALVPAHRIAVLGNIFTAPHARGQGYATAITAELVAALLEQGFSLVVLNVFADNAPAIHIYQRLGFHTYHHLVTGKAALSR
jgi:ribosomal protein S18 acetylase RimI-like enzyme